MKNMNSHSNTLSRTFSTRRMLGDIAYKLDLALDNLRIAPRVREDEGTSVIRISVGESACITLTAEGSFFTSIKVTSEFGDNRIFGALVNAVRSLSRVREQRSERRTCARVVRRELVKIAPDYNTQLRRLGLTVSAFTLAEFLEVVARELPSRLVIPSRVLRQAEACVFRRPLDLARIVTDILLNDAHRLPYKERFGLLHGFRLNLSESQQCMHREDYTVSVDGHIIVGHLHCTLGNRFSPADCASVHWGYLGSKVVLTRIGRHGRTSRSS